MADDVQNPKEPRDTSLWQEPESQSPEFPALYPYNRVTQTESGHKFEMDDTPSRERIRLQHGKSKNFIEMHTNGDQVYKVFGDNYQIIAGKNNVEIKGFCNITIHGDANMHVKGDMSTRVDGDYNMIVQGDYNLRAKGEMEFLGDMDIALKANENFGGAVRLSGAFSLDVNSDLYVNGSIVCDSLTAESRVNANLGVYAGPYGFCSSFGGLSLGWPTPATPVAVPGCIHVIGSIFAPIGSVVAPLGLFSVMMAIWMTDVVNVSLHDVHFHIGNKGFPTSPPIPPMV